jgi:hypothetical protein
MAKIGRAVPRTTIAPAAPAGTLSMPARVARSSSLVDRPMHTVSFPARLSVAAESILGVSALRVAIVLAIGVLAFAGCASEPQTRTVTVTKTASPGEPPDTSPAPREHHRRRHVSRPRPKPAPVFVACDANIKARAATTSCPFAENVFYEFWRASENGDDAFSAYSPVMRKDYEMSCSADATVSCLAGDGGEVRFSMAAVNAYTVEQGARYARTHDLGANSDAPTPSEPPPDAPKTDPGPEDTACDPSYEGECLDPSASDYDCVGGSGDGPEYTGTVSVVGDDHFGLDRDGDGIGCE